MNLQANKLNFQIDEEKCTKCGLCVDECVFCAITMEDYPEMKYPNSCLQCEHCVALCPQGAVSLFEKPLNEPALVKDFVPDYNYMKNLVYNRRSIRKYKNKNIDKETIKELCKTALYAPTGKNTRAVHFTVIDDKAVLNDFRKKVYEKLLNDDFSGKPELKMVAAIAKIYRKTGKDIVFAEAPHIVVASASEKAISPDIDTVIALSYFEMLAVSKGIGTLWNGILNLLINNIYPDLAKELGIPDSHKIGYAMAFGFPAISYKKTINRDSDNIHFVK